MSLSRLMDEIDLKPGTVIIREGNTGGEFFIVIEGTIEVKRKGRRLARLGPGDYLGEIALIDHGPRTATAMVETEARLLVLASREFHSMLASDPRDQKKNLTSVCARRS